MHSPEDPPTRQRLGEKGVKYKVVGSADIQAHSRGLIKG